MDLKTLNLGENIYSLARMIEGVSSDPYHRVEDGVRKTTFFYRDVTASVMSL